MLENLKNFNPEPLKQPETPPLKPDESDLKLQEKNPTHSYTVQEIEKYTDIIKNSLKAKDIENPTNEQRKIRKSQQNHRNTTSRGR